MAPSHPLLVWPRSDGRPERHPPPSSEKNSGWFEKLPLDHAKYTLYCEKIGRHVAENILGIQGLKKPRIDMPEGYALFVHKKPQADNSIREDVYLYGSPIAKFRSPNEFVEHVDWLFDLSKDLKDHGTCGCKYNSKSAIAKEKKRKSEANAPTSAAKRLAADTGSGTRTPEKKKKKAPEPEEEPLESGVVPERAIDQTTQRRFRKGELVFFRITTISPPKGSSFPEITHWPGLIASITQRTKIVDEATVQTFEHSIRPLGMFANSHEVTRDTSDILPYSAAIQLLGGTEGWHSIGKESSRVLEEGVEREAAIAIPSHQSDIEGVKLEERWKKRWGQRIKFTELPSDWDSAIVRLGIALRMSRNIASCWSQTDKFEVLPVGTIISLEEIRDIESRKTSLYQGLWYQGERLWTDDVVRLRKRRADIPRGAVAEPSPGAVDRGVFLYIKKIALVNQNENQNKASGDSGKDLWRCMLYGDIYELSETAAPDAPDWKPPAGLHFRRINDETKEGMVDVFDIAGRLYTDLLDKDSAWFYDPNAPEGRRSGRVAANNGIMEIVGYKPSTRQCDCTAWKDDLYVMVREATADIERTTREHYGTLLAKALGYKRAAPITPSKVANGLAKAPAPNGVASPTPSALAPTPIASTSKASSPTTSKTAVFLCNAGDVNVIPSAPNAIQSPVFKTTPELQQHLDVAAAHLRAGQAVAFPTETVYGLGAHSLDKSATDKIYAIKNRPSDNPLIMHVSSLDMLSRLLPEGWQPSELYKALMDEFWPGPLTLLFPNPSPPPTPAPQTNAIRMPQNLLALALISTADLPVSAPSANSSGRPSPTRAEHVVHDLDGREGLGCILDGGPCGVGVESTVVDALAWTQGGGGSVNVLRPGGLGVEDVARVVNKVDSQFGGTTTILLQGKPWTAGTANGGSVKVLSDDDLPPSTPGMKYRHYSPSIPVQLLLPSNIFPRPPVTGPTTDPLGVVRALVGDKRVGFLHYEGSPLSAALAQDKISLERRSLGKDAASAAQHLFDGLLALEKEGVQAILVEGCSDDGLGLAVMERIGKAVGGGGVSGSVSQGQVTTPGAEGRFWVEV